jgi:ABC-type nitrate/sulfonate/bicarbonate transport system permease component
MKKLLPVWVCIALVLLWEGSVRLARVPSYVLPAPSDVVRALFSDGPALALHAWVTVGEAASGLLIALLCALALGILMDAFPAFRRSVYPILVVTQTVPMIVLAPILIIYLGFGLAPKILTVVLMCFFPVAVSFADGMREMDPAYDHLVRSFGASKLQAYGLVKIPYALTSLISGLKVAATYSISGAVVGEWIGAQSGLGYYLLRVKNGYALDKMFACVLVIVILSIAMNGVVLLSGRLAMPQSKKRKGEIQ